MGNRPGGILEVEAPLHVSKVQLICPSCGKAARTGHRINDAGKKVRVCKACNQDVD
jgi:large subunit ribosomal protein L24